MAVGIERYRADLVRAEKIYFTGDGGSVVTPAHETPIPAVRFSASAVDAAVRACGRLGQIKYREFCAPHRRRRVRGIHRLAGGAASDLLWSCGRKPSGAISASETGGFIAA